MEREARNPSQAEFAEYLHQNQGRLYGYLHALVRDLNDADDLFQQTAVILWKKFPEFDPARSFFSWACGIARLEVANFLRVRGRRRLYFSDDFNLLLIEAQEEMTDAEIDGRREALTQCIEKLRARDRALLDECYNDAPDLHAIADKHGRSTHSIYNSLRRIRRSLFECIGRTLAHEARPGWKS